MLNTPLSWTFLIALALKSVLGSTCQPKLVQVALDDNALSNGAKIRGAILQVGTPPQNLSMLVSGTFNETYIYSSTNGYCATQLSNTACDSLRGGRYSSQSSSTQAAPASDKKVDFEVTASWRSDTIGLAATTNVSNFEFGVPTKDIGFSRKTQSQLGLGRNSSLLATLKDTGRIAARGYSLFWGLSNGPADSQTPGSLVLGGYDEALIANTSTGFQNLTLPLNYDNIACKTGMVAIVNGVALNWPNGTNSNLINAGGQAFSACLIPEFAGLMTMPGVVWDKLQSVAGGRLLGRDYAINYQSMLYDAQGVYPGDMTLSFQSSSAFNIRVPNSQLVVPPTKIDASTGLIDTNNTVRDIVINKNDGTNANDIPILGRLFFTSTYLNVNHDAGTFTLWQANPRGGPSSLKVVDTQNRIVENTCAETNGTPTHTGAGAPTTTTSLSNGNHESKKISTAAIVGIIVGAVAGTALLTTIAILTFLHVRRRKSQGVELSDEIPPVPPYNSKPGFGTYAMEMQGEVDASELPSLHTLELPGDATPAELDAALPHKEAVVRKVI